MSTFQQYRRPLNIGLSANYWTYRKKLFTIQFVNKFSRSWQNFMLLRLLVAEIIGVGFSSPPPCRISKTNTPCRICLIFPPTHLPGGGRVKSIKNWRYVILEWHPSIRCTDVEQ